MFIENLPLGLQTICTISHTVIYVVQNAIEIELLVFGGTMISGGGR
jgi:uncharacterized protein YccT (UPF0319 family)